MTRSRTRIQPDAASQRADGATAPISLVKPARSNRADARAQNRAKARLLTSDPLLPAAEGAADLGIGLSTFWLYVSKGRLPRPVYPTPRSPRWRLSELRAAIATERKANTTPNASET